MKKIMIAVLFFLFGVSLANASGPCGANDLPVKVEGGWFISNEVIAAMGGDTLKEIGWRGDKSNWKYQVASSTQHSGKNGFLFKGTGADHERWNPVQKGAGNGGWLRIERAYSGYSFDECTAIYSPDKILSNGVDPDGLGPAFAMCKGSTPTAAPAKKPKDAVDDAFGQGKKN